MFDPMARALSNGKTLFASLSDGIVLCSRRISSMPGRWTIEEIAGMKKSGVAISDAAASPMPWVPDPVTGYYRPANFHREIDPAELRQVFLKNKD